MDRIGIVGLGRMGSAIAQRLASQGCKIATWTRSGRSFDGIPLAADLPSLVTQSNTLILSLLSDDAVGSVLEAIMASDIAGKQILETSTVVPTVLKNRIARIEAKDATAVDAPISGGPDLVLAGRCGVFIGGSKEAAKRAKATLAPLTERIFHVGPLGTGLAMKAINNGMLQAYFAGLQDMMPLAREAGLPLETALRILSGGPAGIPMVADRIPKVLNQDDTVGFEIRSAVKDADVFLRIAKTYGLAAPSLERFAEIARAATEAGLGGKDPALMIARAYSEGGKAV